MFGRIEAVKNGEVNEVSLQCEAEEGCVVRVEAASTHLASHCATLQGQKPHYVSAKVSSLCSVAM